MSRSLLLLSLLVGTPVVMPCAAQPDVRVAASPEGVTYGVTSRQVGTPVQIGKCTFAFPVLTLSTNPSIANGAVYWLIYDKCTGEIEITPFPAAVNGSDVPGRSQMTAAVGSETAGIGSQPGTAVALANGNYVVAVSAGSTLSTSLFTRGNSTLQALGEYTVGPTPEHVISADFNGDGNADLAVSSFGNTDTNLGGNIAIFFGKGDGTFAAGPVTSAATPVPMYAADLNGDGKVDLVYGDVNDDQVVLLLGNGDGTFQDPETYPVAGSPQSIVSANFNSDAYPDLSAANYSGGVSILLGSAGGAFQPAQSYPSGNGRATYLATADINGDGKPDLIVANPQASAIAFLFGNGDGTFQAPVAYATGANPGYFSLALTGGQIQIGTFDGVSGDLVITPVIAGGIAGAPLLYGLSQFATGVAAADLNGDGYPDMAVSNQALSVLLRVPGGAFQAPVNYTLQSGSQPVAVAIADVNADGHPDVVAASTQGDLGGTLDVALNTGNGTLGAQSSYALGGYPGGFAGASPSGLAIGDFNGDHKPDAAAGYQTSNNGTGTGGISVLLNAGGGAFHAAVNYAVGAFSVYCTLAGDFNGDGRLDLAACGGAANSNPATPGAVGVLLGNGDGTFQAASLTQVGAPAGFPQAMAAGDVNGDGKLDLAVSVLDSSYNDTIVVLLGNGNGTFRQLAPFQTPAYGEALALVDLNGDGIPDLVVGDNVESVYLLGNGDGTFQSPIYFSSGAAVTGFAVTSWNNDGVAGLAIAQEHGTVEAMESALDPKLYGSAPSLSITKSHMGNFTPGQQGATYTITVSNAASAAPVAGVVTVTDTIPSGLTLVSMTGNNWTCSSNICTRNDALAGGYSYDPVTVTVNVSATASSPQVNMATVSGGGSAGASASDSTIIASGSSCTYSLNPPPPEPPVSSSAGNGTVSVVTPAGCAWTASSNASWLTITSGSSGNGTGTVNYSVAVYAGTTPRTGTLTIAGIAFPLTQLPPPLLTITSSHSGNFFQGETGAAYSIVVSNTPGASPTSGTVTVTENLPSGLALVSMSGGTWTCAANICTATTALLAGASFPTITVTVNVAADAPSPVTNQVSVSGGGSATASGSDPTIIGTSSASCSLTLSPASASLPPTGTSTIETCPNNSGQPNCGVAPEVPVTFTVTPSTSCGAWTVSSSNPEFLQITSGAPGSGTGKAGFTVLNNTHNGQQSYSIAVASGTTSATYSVTEAGSSDSEVYRQIYALYEQLLGRDPDAFGFAFWTGVGGAGLGQMADSFLTSPEAFNSDFAVMAAYQAATGAAPTFAQYASGVASIRAGTSLASLFNSLTGGSFPMASLYQNLLNRAPGPSDSSCTSMTVANCFEAIIGYPSSVTPVGAVNNEFQSTGIYHTADHTNGLYVRMIYYVTLSRDPDPSGLAFWIGVANSGGPGIAFEGAVGYPTRIQILGPGTPNQGFIGSPEFQGLFAN